MKLSKGLPLVLLAAAAAAIPLSAGATRHSVLHFRVVSATVSATLTFHTTNGDGTETTDGTIALKASPKSTGQGAVPGRLSFPLKGTVAERVKTKRILSDTSPYTETCKNTRKLGGSGGLTLKRAGSKIEVRWGFPQAAPQFCHGPKAGSSITSRMKSVYPLSAFSSAHPTIVVSGSAKTPGGNSSLTYRWRATLKLARS